MLTRTRHLKGGLTAKAFAVFMAFVLCVGFVPFVPTIAYADDSLIIGGSPDLLRSGNVVTGGDTIEFEGTYTLADDATGTITVAENVDATVVASDYDESTGKFTGTHTNLNFVIRNKATLTLKNVRISLGKAADPAVDFEVAGTFKVSGVNLFERATKGGSNALIHVGPGKTATLDGDGVLYAYKAALGADIGSNGGEAVGAVTIDGGTWFLAGNQTGPVIGGDSSEATNVGGPITINDGKLYLKSVSKSAVIGASKEGCAPNVFINGGLIELFTDFSGSTIGDGHDHMGAGTVTFNGGSVKTVLGKNAWGSADGNVWNLPDDKLVADFAQITDATITAAHNTALLVFDASKYASSTEVGTENLTVKVDGTVFYSGGLYGYLASELKNPVDNDTLTRWVTNDSSSAYPDDIDKSTVYPSVQGSTFAVDTNLYFQLSKSNHTLTVNGDEYAVTWDEQAGAFSIAAASSAYKWYTEASGDAYEIGTAAELAEFAEIVNGTASGVGQDNFAGKTVTLAADVDLSAIAWTPIGTAAAPFAGTFDGAGKAITGLSIAGGTGYTGLFGYNAGTVKNFTLAGSVAATSGDFVGAVAGFNSGTIQGVVSSVEVSAGNAYNVGGIAGLSTSGTWVDSSGVTQQIAGATGLITECSTSGAVTGYNKVGGIVGENAGTVSKCSSSATVDGTNAGSKNGVGGIVGRNGNNNTAIETGTVDSCYFVGTVGRSGQKWTGGIAGLNNGKSSVANCYMAGTLVAGGAGNNNAIVGKQEGSATNNYALSGLPNTGNSETEVGIVKTADEMKTPLFVLQLNGGGSAFNVDSGNINGGLPCLAWEGGTPAAATDIPAIAAAVDAINAIGTPVTIDSKDQIEAAQAAYAAMTDEEKALLPANAQAAYDAALAAYGAALTAQVQDLVAAFPADVTTTEGMAAVENALAAYNALSADQKANVPSATLAALVSAQQVVANAKIEAAIAQANAAEQERQAAVASAAASQAQVTQLQSDLAQAKASQGKAINPMTVQAKTITVKVKKKKTTFNMSQAFTLKNAKGKVTFAKVAGNDKVSITNGGKVTVKKGLKKGKSYKISVLVCAAGNGSYCPAVKTVTLVVKAKK